MLELFTTTLISTFLSVNSIGKIPILMALLEKYSQKQRRAFVRKSTLVAFTVFLLFSFFGQYIFQLMHIEMYSFYIAGGILLSYIAMRMLSGQSHEAKMSAAELKETAKEKKEELENLSITPIAVPLMTGPASITLGLMLFSSIQFNSIGALGQAAEFVAGAIVSYFAAYLVISRSEAIEKAMGKTGIKVMSRVMGLLLLSIGVQFVANGLLKIAATL
ncbi:MAG: MarC family protein [Candidatus Diapherotrites archaeon]|nr:MarC family protein [Candidatus Diapherotrites archaeon]